MDTPVSNRYTLLQNWQDAKAVADNAVTRERELRSQVIEAFSEETNEMSSGTESIDIGQGYDLKIMHSLDYKLPDADTVDTVLEKIENSMEGGSILAERLVKFKPEISVTEYKKLPAPQKAMIDKILTIKPSSKAIKIHKRGK